MSNSPQPARNEERRVGQRRVWPPTPSQSEASFELAATFAHDLRSPIAAIQILAAGLQEGSAGHVNARQRRQLGMIRSAAISVCILATDLEELARGKRYPLDGQPEPFSIHDLFADVQSVVGPLQEIKALALNFDAPPPAGGADRRVGHPRALHRILINLAMNALQAADSGTVIIAARPRDARRVEFSVTDNGPGFDAQGLAPGLGLRICRDLVGALGSALEMATPAGGGARVAFTVDLPLVAAPAISV